MKIKPLNAKEVVTLSPERQHIAKVFKKHVDAAIAELGGRYDVNLQGCFNKTPIAMQIEVTSKEEIP